jgi:hypothetical protein
MEQRRAMASELRAHQCAADNMSVINADRPHKCPSADTGERQELAGSGISKLKNLSVFRMPDQSYLAVDVSIAPW